MKITRASFIVSVMMVFLCGITPALSGTVIISCGPLSKYEEWYMDKYGESDISHFYDWCDGVSWCTYSYIQNDTAYFNIDEDDYGSSVDPYDVCEFISMDGCEEYELGNRLIEVVCTTADIEYDETTGWLNDYTLERNYTCNEQGYYISTLNGENSVCSRCPTEGGATGTTYYDPNDEKSNCYLPNGTSRTFSDTTGSGTSTTTEDCYWQEN